MKTRTTLIMMLLTLGVGAWLLLKETGGVADLGGHLLFDWSGTAQKQDKAELKVDVTPKEVTGIDLKSATMEISLRRETDGMWAITKGVQDRADQDLVKSLLEYLGTAKITDVISTGELDDGKLSSTSLGLDDTGSWRVTWLGADSKPLAEMRAGKTAPLGNAGYVQLSGVKSRPDVYIVRPDLRPILSRPLDSYRDPKACRYPEELIQRYVIRKGEGEVEISRSMVPKVQKKDDGKGGPPVQKVSLEPGEWLITKPLANAPAEQKVAQEFVSEICSLRVKGWVPYTETTDKPLVEVTVVPPLKGTKGITLSFYPDPSAPDATAICRDAQRKAAFKVDKEKVDYFSLADSPNPFRSRKLPTLVEPGMISTVEVRTPMDSVILARVGNKWSWRPLSGGAWADASVERLEKLLEVITESEVIDFVSDSLDDPKAFALDKPDYVITLAAGRNESLENLRKIDGEDVPLKDRNNRSLRIAIRQDGQIFANYAGDPFVYRVGPEVTSAIPMSFSKWRSLALPGFSINQVRSIKRTVGTNPPLQMNYDRTTLKWTVLQAGADVTPLYSIASIEQMVNKLSTLTVANWLDNQDDANKSLGAPSVIIELVYDSYGEKVSDTKTVTATLTLAPMPTANAPLCYGKHSEAPGPFLIKVESLRDMAADLKIK